MTGFGNLLDLSLLFVRFIGRFKLEEETASRITTIKSISNPLQLKTGYFQIEMVGARTGTRIERGIPLLR